MTNLRRSISLGAVIPTFLVFASLVFASYPKARIAETKTDLRNILSSLQIYKLENFDYPSGSQGLLALVEKPVGEPEAINWQEGGYLDRFPKDPWGRHYMYRNPGVVYPVEVYSFGRDGKLGGCGEDADFYSSNIETAASKSFECRKHRVINSIWDWVANNIYFIPFTLIIFGLLMIRSARKAVKSVCGNLYRFLGWTITGLGGLLLLLLLFGPKYYH